ncbi:MAG: tyrosine-type recombinase/integrase [Gemmatimonadota bacterium]
MIRKAVSDDDSDPPHLHPLLAEHEERWAGRDHYLLSADGRPLTGNALYQAFVRSREQVGLQLTFHDLRHTGQSLAAAEGANLADLKGRLGHSSTAAVRYLHAVEGRDAAIAAALSTIAAQDDASILPQGASSAHRPSTRGTQDIAQFGER